MRLRPLPLLIVAHALALANLLILFGALPLWLRLAGAILLAVLLPGVLLAVVLAGEPRSGVAWLERGLEGLAAGFGVATLTMLLLGYLPGGVERWMAPAALNGIVVVLALVVGARHLPAVEPPLPQAARLWGALALVLAVGALLRLTWLGYSEFQGDEARVLLRAGDLLLGFENTPFVHQKPPGEFLITAAILSLAGQTTEAAARLPFTLANLGGLAAITLLGWRMFGPLGGLTAGLLLAVDGYMVAFGRIVQYQSVILLASVVVILLLYRLWLAPERPGGPLALAGWIGAGALLAHFEALGIALPALLILGAIGLKAGGLRTMRALLPALALAAGIAALFYIPYVRYPGFETAYAYVANERLGLHFPYNNLVDFFQRTMVYSSSYSVVALVGGALLGLGVLYRRQFGATIGIGAAAITAALAAVALLRPAWFTVGASDLSGLLPAIPLALLVLLPRLTLAERSVWLWFGPLAIGSLFLIVKPDSHVYTFFIPWALVVGAAVQEASAGLVARPPLWRWSAATVGLMLLVLFAAYPWLIFSDAPAERFRRWEEAQPRAYWYPFAQPPERAIMGFPLRNGWKAVGALYAEGALDGSFESNARPEVADWYTRGQGVCPAPQRYYFLTQTVEPTDDAFLEQVRQEAEGTYGLLGSVTVRGQERLRLYAQGAEGEPAAFPVEEYIAAFDALTTEPMQSRRGRVLEAAPATPTDLHFGETIRLRGYTLEQPAARAGESIPITLYWESVRPEYVSYTVFLHVVDPATNAKVAQTDALPVCGQTLTARWNPGDLVRDPQQITIFADAAPGSYRLYLGLYDVESGARMPLVGPDGRPQGDFVDLTEIRVAE